MSQEDLEEHNNTWRSHSAYLIEKSSTNIHQTFNPTSTLTAIQAKVLHAVQYKLQQMCLELNYSPQEFHLKHTGPLVVSMDSSEFRRLIDCESRNTAYIRKAMKELSTLSASQDTFTEDPVNGSIKFVNFFIGAEYTNSKFTFILPPHTVKSLVTDNKSAVIDVLTVAQSLDSKYAVFFNDLLEEWSFKENTDDFRITVTDAQLRNLLKIPFKLVGKKKVYTYPQPAALIRTAVQPAITQINNANLRFEVTEFNHSKVDGELYWVFDVVSRKTMALHNFAAQNAVELDDIRKTLREFGVTPSGISKVMNSIDTEKELDYVQFNIDIVRQKKKSNTINTSQAALFMSIMQNNREAHDEKWTDLKRERQLALTIKKARYEDQLEQQRLNAVEEYFEQKAQIITKQLHSGTKKHPGIVEEFLEYLTNIPTKTSAEIQASVEISGLTSSQIDGTVFQRFLKSYIKKHMDKQEMEDFVNKSGTRINW